MTKTRATVVRTLAVQILGEVRRRDARARDMLRGSRRMDALGERDRAQVTRLVLGVIGASGLLDEKINSHLKSRAGVEPKVRDALLAASYELLFLSTPPSVAVSQGVELVREVRPRAAGMANAVLRRVAQEDVPARDAALERMRLGNANCEELSLASGYPVWLLRRLREDRGRDACLSFARAASEPAPIYVAPNLASTNVTDALEAMERAGLEPHALDEPPDAIEVGRPAGLFKSGLVQNVTVVPADLSAQRIASLVVPSSDGRLLEVGQGRGTKSLLMLNAARRMGCELGITGVDVEKFKVEVARRRMRDAGVSDRVACVALDARMLGDSSSADALATREPYDVVFVDAPCSGTGTLRRHPEITWSLAAKDVESLHELQRGLLQAASTWVRPGGMLCYATCSVLRHENEHVVSEFLSSAAGASFGQEAEPFQSIPGPHAPDGHFCIRLRRT